MVKYKSIWVHVNIIEKEQKKVGYTRKEIIPKNMTISSYGKESIHVIINSILNYSKIICYLFL